MKKIFLFICCLFCVGAALAVRQKSYQDIDFKEVDKYTLDAPIIDNEKDLPDLVTYLIKPYKEDIQKARAVFAWIVYNIDYDDYEYRFDQNAIDKGGKFESLGDILETRTGVCRDIADLYNKMAQKAGLKTQVVTGIAGQNLTKKNEKYNRHSWLVIDIDGEWEYLDPTWAIQGQKAFQNVTKDRQYRREMKQRLKDKDRLNPRKERNVGNTYFLADKDAFSQTHYPDDEKWQLQRKPVSLTKFLSRSQQ